jgi:hypothetical protein
VSAASAAGLRSGSSAGMTSRGDAVITVYTNITSSSARNTTNPKRISLTRAAPTVPPCLVATGSLFLRLGMGGHEDQPPPAPAR